MTTEHYDLPSAAMERNLLQTRVFGDETFAEHKKKCLVGCALCSVLRCRERAIRESENREVAGVSGKDAHNYKVLFSEQGSISYWFKNKTDIRNPKGGYYEWVYILLQSEDFSDSQIRKYFNINNSEWQRFKKNHFPTWKDDKYDILAERGSKAFKIWKEAQVRSHN